MGIDFVKLASMRNYDSTATEYMGCYQYRTIKAAFWSKLDRQKGCSALVRFVLILRCSRLITWTELWNITLFTSLTVYSSEVSALQLTTPLFPTDCTAVPVAPL